MSRPGVQALKRLNEAGDVKIEVIFKLEKIRPLRSTKRPTGCP